MRRWHTKNTSGSGVFGISPEPAEHEDDAMYLANGYGFWVLYSEAKAAIEAARQEGQNRTFLAYDEYARTTPAKEELQPAVSAPLKIVDLKATRENQLLNELYHDRARLEKVVANASTLAREAAEAIKGVLDEIPVSRLNQASANVIVVGAKLAQFHESNAV